MSERQRNAEPGLAHFTATPACCRRAPEVQCRVEHREPPHSAGRSAAPGLKLCHSASEVGKGGGRKYRHGHQKLLHEGTRENGVIRLQPLFPLAGPHVQEPG